MTSTSSAERSARVRAIAEQRRDDRGPLMPILHDLIGEFGHIERPDIETVADVLNLSVADVHGVVSFYHDFRTTPPAPSQISICRGEACQAVGAQTLYDEVKDTVGADVEVREVFCLGNCALGPSGMIDGRLRGRLDTATLVQEVTR